MLVAAGDGEPHCLAGAAGQASDGNGPTRDLDGPEWSGELEHELAAGL